MPANSEYKSACVCNLNIQLTLEKKLPHTWSEGNQWG
jgi:hypothetical protein